MTSKPDPQPVIAPEEAETLLEAVVRLSENVTVLSAKLDISSRQSRQTRVLTFLVALIVLVGGTIGAVQWGRVTSALEGNTSNAIQSCENANETRAANLALWTTVLGNVQEVNTANESEAVGRLLSWIAVLYQPHDCDDLGREYEIPPPPDLTA